MFVAFVPYGIFASFFGAIGYVIACVWFSPLVTATALLTEPPVAQTIGYLMKIDKFPGALTIIGGVLALIGLFFYQLAEKKRE